MVEFNEFGKFIITFIISHSKTVPCNMVATTIVTHSGYLNLNLLKVNKIIVVNDEKEGRQLTVCLQLGS